MFFAAVEIKDNPSLKDVPLAVGGMSMISTTNYLARQYGVRAAMPGFIGRKLCPQLVFAPLRMNRYIEVSKIIMNIIKEYDEHYQAFSCDEAYGVFLKHWILVVFVWITIGPFINKNIKVFDDVWWPWSSSGGLGSIHTTADFWYRPIDVFGGHCDQPSACKSIESTRRRNGT